MEVISSHEENHSTRSIAEKYGVCKTQIQDIIRNKDKIREIFKDGLAHDRRVLQTTTTYENVNKLTAAWVDDIIRSKLPLSGPLIKAQALHYATELGVPAFKASNGWLDSFKKRHQIAHRTLSGERTGVFNLLTRLAADAKDSDDENEIKSDSKPPAIISKHQAFSHCHDLRAYALKNNIMDMLVCVDKIENLLEASTS